MPHGGGANPEPERSSMTFFENLRRRFINFCIQTLWRWEREVLRHEAQKRQRSATMSRHYTTWPQETVNYSGAPMRFGPKSWNFKPDDNVS